jgi:integrase
VFTNIGGRPISPDRLSINFGKLIAASGLPPIRLHDLRHGAASLALQAGADLKVVQDQLDRADRSANTAAPRAGSRTARSAYSSPMPPRAAGLCWTGGST